MYAWTPDTVLNMPAVRFFALFKAGRVLKRRDEARLFMELCDVVQCAVGDKDYHDKLRAIYYGIASGKEEQVRAPRVLNSEDPATGKTLEALFSSVVKGRRH